MLIPALTELGDKVALFSQRQLQLLVKRQLSIKYLTLPLLEPQLTVLLLLGPIVIKTATITTGTDMTIVVNGTIPLTGIEDAAGNTNDITFTLDPPNKLETVPCLLILPLLI